MATKSPKETLSYVDVFAGCGGLSLGLSAAGWQGTFAIEKHPDAFATYHRNLIDAGGKSTRYNWPVWLPQSAHTTSDLLRKYSTRLRDMQGQVTLLAGGPPCQGFSMAGRRDQADPRNALTEEYMRLIKLIQPRFVVLENVRGFTMAFRKNALGSDDLPYALRVRTMLQKLGYVVFSELVELNQFAVPQNRRRFILVAIRAGDPSLAQLANSTPFDMLYAYRKKFLASKRLPTNGFISVKDAIGDLEVTGSELTACTDTTMRAYQQVAYRSNGFESPFVALMQKGAKSPPNSLRLPKHSETTIRQFEMIMSSCKAGRTISDADRLRLNMKKQVTTPLSADMPSATITTLPDDIIHYSEPRVLTARENARLQTFPDSFEFLGKYTTGGTRRKTDCPRYTQIGNAVPPLFAEALGRVLKALANA
jgi:DNA (cytosine-5)-methyltransferase 1